MIEKIAAGVLGLSVVAIGGIAIAKLDLIGLSWGISWKPLVKDDDYESKKSSDYGDTKFGGKYKYYLVGMNPDNESWWKKKHAELEKDNPQSGKFSVKTGNENKVDKPFDDNDTKALNKVCFEAYKTTVSELQEDSSSDTSKFKKSEVWKYCSGLGGIPKTIKDADTSNQKYQTQIDSTDPIGKDTTNRGKFVSIIGNDEFWRIRDKEFRGEDGYEKIETTDDTFFNSSSKKDKTIKDLCEEAYGKKAEASNSTESAPTKDKALKYCSLDKSSS